MPRRRRSLAGLVYREASELHSLRTANQLSLTFGESTYSSIVWTGRGFLSAPRTYYNAPISGSYTYEKVSENEYLVKLNAEGVFHEATLTFTDDTSGTVLRHFRQGDGFPYQSDGTFHLAPAPDDTRRTLVNISARVVARAGEPAIVGFVIAGTESKDVLIRAVGPGLVGSGVTDAWATPTFELHPREFPWFAGDHLLSLNTGTWSSSPEAAATNEQAFARAGAVPLERDSRDLSDVVRLDPGAHTIVVVAPEGSAGGTMLIEVYEL